MSQLLSNLLVTVYMVLSLIWDQSQLSSFIRLEMASMNNEHVQIANFPWIWPQMSLLLEVKTRPIAISRLLSHLPSVKLAFCDTCLLSHLPTLTLASSHTCPLSHLPILTLAFSHTCLLSHLPTFTALKNATKAKCDKQTDGPTDLHGNL